MSSDPEDQPSPILTTSSFPRDRSSPGGNSEPGSAKLDRQSSFFKKFDMKNQSESPESSEKSQVGGAGGMFGAYSFGNADSESSAKVEPVIP